MHRLDGDELGLLVEGMGVDTGGTTIALGYVAFGVSIVNKGRRKLMYMLHGRVLVLTKQMDGCGCGNLRAV